ncbi:serine/threonine-protein kinase [Streptomyces boninensis]|uniref:serine/threonine-protein kinase n=1 Tax=Streptomyces boninensis TaxID=2039455 RepID=UPI003B20D6FA
MWHGVQADEAGRLIAGRYRLHEQIGRGGMGTVWRAEDELLGRHVAFKKLHLSPHLGDDERATLFERTRREARSAARITHPNVVVVHDVVDDDGLPCIVMEYVPSRTLGDVLKEEGPLSAGEAARIGRGMIAALRAAHAAGVLHRDVKPGNVLLGDDGRVVLTDFGIAVSSNTSTLTRTGELVGSVDFCAPERVKGRTPGAASDLWALGATLYQAVEGRPPFRRATAIETAYAIAAEPQDPPRGAGVLAPLIDQLLAKEPADRPSAEAVEQWLREPEAGAETAHLDFGGRTPVPEAGPATGRTGTAATTPLPAPDEASSPRSGPARRPRRTAFVAAVAIVLIAATTGAFLALRGSDDGQQAGPKPPQTSNSSKDKSSPAPKPSPVPKGYRLVKEKAFGVALPVPANWTRQQLDGDLGAAYIDPTGMVSLRVSALDMGTADHLQHWKDNETKAVEEGKLPGYRQLRMQKTAYRGRPAAIWEFTWQGKAREWRASDLGFGRPGEREYALYLSAPSADWARYKPVFDHARNGFRFPAQQR